MSAAVRTVTLVRRAKAAYTVRPRVWPAPPRPSAQAAAVVEAQRSVSRGTRSITTAYTAKPDRVNAAASSRNGLLRVLAGAAQQPPAAWSVSGWSNRPAPPHTPVSGRTSSTRSAASRSPGEGGGDGAGLLVAGHGQERRGAAVGLHADQVDVRLCLAGGDAERGDGDCDGQFEVVARGGERQGGGAVIRQADGAAAAMVEETPPLPDKRNCTSPGV
jgi:hypothetical protein